MIHYLETKISKLRYSDQGEGEVLVLLHGYLEAIETFDAFTKDLATKVRVICKEEPSLEVKILLYHSSLKILFIGCCSNRD